MVGLDLDGVDFNSRDVGIVDADGVDVDSRDVGMGVGVDMVIDFKGMEVGKVDGGIMEED
ncbi:hypothetical protein KI387_007786, partial [Taxus chinensis]